MTVFAVCTNLTVLELGRNVRVLDTLIIAGGGTFKGKNGAKVRIPETNLNDKTYKALKSALVSGPRMCVAKTCEVNVEFFYPSGNAMVPNQHSHFTGTYLGIESVAFCTEIVESNNAYSFAAPIFDDYSSVGYSLFLKKKKGIIIQLDQVVMLYGGCSFWCIYFELSED